jgi:protein O-GlcNAc transferase
MSAVDIALCDDIRALAAKLAGTGALPPDAAGHADAVSRGLGGAESLALLAFACKRLGAVDMAIPLLQEAARIRPDSPSPPLFLGHHFLECDRPADAVAILTAAARQFPTEIEIHSTLGAALQGLGRLNDALASVSRALALAPEDARSHFNLARTFQLQGRQAIAAKTYRRAIELDPGLLPASINLANCLRDDGMLDDAATVLEDAALEHSDAPDLLINLGDLYRARNRLDEAEAMLRRALALAPGNLGGRLNLAVTLHDLNRLDEALAECDEVAAKAPNVPVVHLNRAAILRALNRLADAEAACRRCLELDPDMRPALTSLGAVLMAAGRIAEAVEAFAAALHIAPDDRNAHSNLIFALDLLPGTSPAIQQGERQRWWAIHRPLEAAALAPANDRDPDRRLRVGYVSSDFRRHSAAIVFAPVLLNHDSAAIELVCYSATGGEDDVTGRFRRRADLWRDIHGLSDTQLAELVRADGIDILVDLSGHSAGNRLGTFALKPAPIQVTAWGHANGTGLAAMDVLFADPVAIPAAERPLYAETIIDLPGLLCFEPPAEAPPVAPRAADSPPVLGFFGRAAKVSDETIALWARVLQALPACRLLLKDRAFDDAATRARIADAFARAGIEPARLDIRGGSGRAEHLAAHGDVDVVLDPVPHGGGVTTFEALWMGVPVVTLPHPTLAGRLTASILSGLGLTDGITADPDGFTAAITTLMADHDRRAELRRTLRQRMIASPLCDGMTYARAVEAAYRRLWRSWCADGRAVPARAPSPPGETLTLPSGRHDFASAYALYAGALELEKLGRYAEAERALRTALATCPDYPEALHQLAHLREQVGDLPAAERLYRALPEMAPDYARGICALASFEQRQGRFDTAVAGYQQALAIDPDIAEAQSNLATIRMAAGELDAAKALLIRAIQIDPAMIDAHIQLGLLHDRLGDKTAAESSLHTALRQDADNILALRSLCQILEGQGRYDEALTFHERAAKVVPPDTWALLNYASALRRKSAFHQGLDLILQAIALSPDLAEAQYNLGNTYSMLGRSDLAIEAYEKALEVFGENSAIFLNLGNVYSMAGRMDEAMAFNTKALDIAPDKPTAYINRIFFSDYDPTLDAEQQQALRKDWYERFGRPVRDPRPHANVPDPGRRLRVGYLSGDFFRHSASQIFALVVLNHNQAEIEVVCYANNEMEDVVTEQFRQGTDEWNVVSQLTDEELADKIRADSIDILVDLSAHSGRTRIGVLPRKPAPIQVTAWGHANGTGCPEVDVLFSDPVVIPPEERRFYAETIVDLPCFICLRPPNSPPVGMPPALAAGRVTFGCLTRVSKVSEASLRLWANILERVPDSVLLLKDKELDSVELCADVTLRAEAAGIPADRLLLRGCTSHYNHLGAYNDVDIALDPFPYGGGVSTAEALWMGVPVVAKLGHNHVGRLAASVITAAGQGWSIAADDDGYADLAVALAADLPRLTAIRANLRQCMAGSALTRSDLYVADVERTYRRLWREWCAKHDNP